MTDDERTQGRSARDESTARILEAAAELFARRGYSAVSVREVAAAAGVSHALVHRYLGSKEQVYQAVLRHFEETLADAVPAGDGLMRATSLMLREAWLKQRVYLRLVIHSTMNGLPYEATSGRFVATERLVELARAAAAREDGLAGSAPEADPRFVVAGLVAMLLGWTAARDWLLPAVGLGEMSDDEFLRSFERLLLDVERLYFPAADG